MPTSRSAYSRGRRRRDLGGADVPAWAASRADLGRTYAARPLRVYRRSQVGPRRQTTRRLAPACEHRDEVRRVRRLVPQGNPPTRSRGLPRSASRGQGCLVDGGAAIIGPPRRASPVRFAAGVTSTRTATCANAAAKRGSTGGALAREDVVTGGGAPAPRPRAVSGRRRPRGFGLTENRFAEVLAPSLTLIMDRSSTLSRPTSAGWSRRRGASASAREPPADLAAARVSGGDVYGRRRCRGRRGMLVHRRRDDR